MSGQSNYIIVSYVLDYALVIGCVVGFACLNLVDGFKQSFALSNISLQYPYVLKEHVPVWLLICISILAPIVIILCWIFMDTIIKRSNRRYERKVLWDMSISILGLLVSLALTFFLTQVFKITVGKPRPDLLARCIPETGVTQPSYGLVNVTICTQTNKTILSDGFKSFPSGHSSLSWAGLGFLSLWIAGRIQVLDQRGQFWKVLLVLVPLLTASYIAISRIEDFRHHGFDVLIGSALGMLFAWVAYRQYFPAVSSPHAGFPYSIRSCDPFHIVQIRPNGNTTPELNIQFEEPA